MEKQNGLEKFMIDRLESSEKNLYTILDTAVDDNIYPKLSEFDIEGVCLYRGQQAKNLAEVAPYLVKLQIDDPFTEWLLSNAEGKNWGIYVESDADLDELKKHFRELLMAYTEEGKLVWFRFYDPRVLRIYLPTCNDEELRAMFGPVHCFCIEDENGNLCNNFLKKDERC